MSSNYDSVDTEDGVPAKKPGCCASFLKCLVECPGKCVHFTVHTNPDDRKTYCCLLTPGHWCQIIAFLVSLWIVSGLFWYLMFFLVQAEPMKALYGFLIACGLFTLLFVVLILTNKEEDDTNLSLGCTVMELKNHIGKQMDPEMSWDTYGTTWKIVHKIPIHEDNASDTSAARIEALCARLHYTNTECVWMADFKRLQNGASGSSYAPPASSPQPTFDNGFEEKTTVVTLHQ